MECIDLDEVRGKNMFDDVVDERLDALHQILKRRNVSALVDFSSLDGLASLLAASRIAPVQVYFRWATTTWMGQAGMRFSALDMREKAVAPMMVGSGGRSHWATRILVAIRMTKSKQIWVVRLE